MAAIALADVSVTLTSQRFFNPPGKPNEAYASIVFGDAALTYDTYGIPVPSPGKFGMDNEILRINLQRPADAYDYVYDPTARTATPVAPNGTIRMYVRTTGLEFSGAVPATTLPVTVIGQ
jgi:hypothetical protein